MELLYKTTMVFDTNFTEAEKAVVQSKITELVSQGKTNGVREASWPYLPATVVRPWINEEAANEWKEFCLTITPAPVSCTVELIL